MFTSPRSRRQHGFSLVESLVCLAVAGTVFAASVPSSADLIERQRSQGQASRFVTDFNHARLHALGNRSPVHVRFAEHPSGTCYTVHQGAKDACTCSAQGEPVCQGAAQLMAHEWLPSTSGVKLQANVSRMTLNPGTMTVTPTGTVRLVNAQGQGSAHVVAITGRIRTVVLP
jgi:type IV fimbrial biogenesis protein FimT